jgi:hypothetical protein
MTESSELQRAMKALRDEESHVTAPPGLQASVLAAWDASHGSRARVFAGRFDAPRVRLIEYGAAAAAGLLLAIGLGELGVGLREASLAPPPRAGTLLLVGAPILENENVRVVRMRMPASRLLNLGFRSTGGAPSDPIDVDVIIGEDGVARAIQFEVTP